MTKNKPKLIMVDHIFHKKTSSTAFFLKLLEQYFSVKMVWEEDWTGKSIDAKTINEIKADYVLFFQVLPPISVLKRIKHKVIWVPMYDQAVNLNQYFWRQLRGVEIKVISFSKTLSKYLKQIGFDVLGVQYYLDPSEFKQVSKNKKLNIFFWQRTNINFEHLKKLIGHAPVEKIYLKLDTDPGFKPLIPSVTDQNKYQIEKLGWFKDPKEVYEILAKCNVFVAPRKYEGIGMSFLEAMSMGLAVVASDTPTMNEYIKDGRNGYLFNLDEISPINFKNISLIMENARLSCISGYNEWGAEKKAINRFILKEFKPALKISLVKSAGLKILALAWMIAIMCKKVYRILIGGNK